jgi:hypothetical protein
VYHKFATELRQACSSETALNAACRIARGSPAAAGFVDENLTRPCLTSRLRAQAQDPGLARDVRLPSVTEAGTSPKARYSLNDARANCLGSTAALAILVQLYTSVALLQAGAMTPFGWIAPARFTRAA